MDRVTLENYRCFREKQSARLAPLTFLVGENSTGKTSFLALLRALWQVAFQDRIPDFRQPPYDLGSFEDVVHYRGANNARPPQFKAGFEYAPNIHSKPFDLRVKFKEREGYPFPKSVTLSHRGAWIETRRVSEEKILDRVGYGKAELGKRSIAFSLREEFPNLMFSLGFSLDNIFNEYDETGHTGAVLEKLNEGIGKLRESQHKALYSPPFASAPIRFRPRRTYDPSRPAPDPEGEYIPDYLASMSRNVPGQWERLKSDLEGFGRDSGLFDEIGVLSFGKTAGAPYQVQIRKFGKRLKGPKRNLIDVGYGVSQALPILTELLREDSPKMFLLQQPEVHLHPKAQAALGSLFCNLAASGKQIIVETHSDYILDRARMDIRDGKTDLKPDDISILYFERDELDVNIHSIRMDEDGNFWDAPLGYRRFFNAETRRYIGL